MKSNRKRIQKEEELEKQTKLNARSLKSGDCMDVDLAFDANTTIEEFIAMVSTKHKKKNNHANKTPFLRQLALLQCKKRCAKHD